MFNCLDKSKSPRLTAFNLELRHLWVLYYSLNLDTYWSLLLDIDKILSLCNPIFIMS